MILLLPSDPLRPRRPDEHFAAEATAARDLGLDVALIDHDTLTVARVPRDAGPAVYRGWMLDAERYARLDAALRERGVELVTTPGQYRRAHELPGWYEQLSAFTPESLWTHGDGREEFDRIRTALGDGPAVLRDYTKSMKHYWHEAAFIPDLADAEAAGKVAARFRELRDDSFTGGYVLRRFEPLGSSEVRTWWINGACALQGPHPDSPDDRLDIEIPTQPYASTIEALKLPFVTLDLARRSDGVWRVVELGDGQVSDCPPTMKDALVRQIAQVTVS